MGKTDIVIWCWDEWFDFCEFYEEDPYEICDYSFDLGGGDTFDIEFKGDVPKKEEA